jgi:hypothetical protein
MFLPTGAGQNSSFSSLAWCEGVGCIQPDEVSRVDRVVRMISTRRKPKELNGKSPTEGNKDNEEFAAIYMGVNNSAAQKLIIGLVEEICHAAPSDTVEIRFSCFISPVPIACGHGQLLRNEPWLLKRGPMMTSRHVSR